MLSWPWTSVASAVSRWRASAGLATSMDHATSHGHQYYIVQQHHSWTTSPAICVDYMIDLRDTIIFHWLTAGPGTVDSCIGPTLVLAYWLMCRECMWVLWGEGGREATAWNSVCTSVSPGLWLAWGLLTKSRDCAVIWPCYSSDIWYQADVYPCVLPLCADVLVI